MRRNLDIQQLMTEKIGGIISAADEAYLDHLIETDGVVAAAWDETKQLFGEEDVNDNFCRFDNLLWQKMPFQTDKAVCAELLPLPVLRHKASIRIRPIIWAAAASLLMLLLAAWWLFRSPAITAPALSLTDAHAGVQLQLGNGKILNLSKDSGLLHTGTLQAINNNKTLVLPVSTIPAHMNNESLTLAVPVSKYYTIKLSDGTQVTLNSASILRFPVPFSADNREIYISGEAFLTVAKDSRHPFLVHTPQGTVQVLGTAFNVNSYDSNNVKISLVEGAVKVKNVILKPGEQAVTTNSGISIHPFDESEELSWRQGIFYFSNTSLSEIARVLPRWFGIPVIMDNNHIAGETFTGSLERSQSINIFLENLKSTTAVDYYFDKNGRLHFK